MRQFLRQLAVESMGFWAKPCNGVYILNGHYLSRLSNNNIAIFDDLLTKMSKHVRFINVHQACELIKLKKANDIDETLVAFTFDDGFDDCYFSLAPALEKHGVNACFFVNPGFIEGDDIYRKRFTQSVVKTPEKRPLSWVQVKELHQRGFVIGNHTFDHVRMSDLGLEKALSQVIEAKSRIENEIGSSCVDFAWPYGQYSDITKSMINKVSEYHENIYSGCDYEIYLAYEDKVLNRRHFEADWSIRELNYFLSKSRSYA